MKNQLRAWSGLILLIFVIGHFSNHALGIISLEAMEAGTRWFVDPWRTGLGTIILLSAFTTHASFALMALWTRTGSRRPKWEWAQLFLGFLAPLLLAAHVAGTRGVVETSDFDRSYSVILAIYWHLAPDRGIIQSIAVMVVWVHGMIGLHTWLRLKPWYRHVRPYGAAFAVGLPILALAGYVSAGIQVAELAQTDIWLNEQLRNAGMHVPSVRDMAANGEMVVQWTVLILILVIAGGRIVWGRLGSRSRHVVALYAPGEQTLRLRPGDSLLDAIRNAGIRHASVCGGRGRCSTCRVRIDDGAESLPSPNTIERKTLIRIQAPERVRLACQLHPTSSLTVAALVRADAGPAASATPTADEQGHEVDAAFLFVDLRGSTRLSEDRLPFDVVFILNRFFAELSLALKETEGHYAQFNGDGLMAIYGLSSPPETSAKNALRGAKRMFERLDALNERLSGELSAPLQIGIGIHGGEAIVGKMGPPQSPIISALGDTVNVAARLESQTKELDGPLVISIEIAKRASLDVNAHRLETVAVKGRLEPMEVLVIADPRILALT